MIIFNTIKAAKHYVKFCNKNHDYSYDGYDWRNRTTYIENNLVKVNESGDGCGCGCDTYIFSYTNIIGRIKSHDTKSIRDNKLKNLGI
jgi:hypothetical protein